MTEFPLASSSELLDPRMRILFVTVNPGLPPVASGAPFFTPSNRFFRALHGSGITGRLVDTSRGWGPEDRDHLLDRGVRITGYRLAFDSPRAVPGRQPLLLQCARVWYVANPSGRNRGMSLQQLVDAYRAAALDAALVLG